MNTYKEYEDQAAKRKAIEFLESGEYFEFTYLGASGWIGVEPIALVQGLSNKTFKLRVPDLRSAIKDGQVIAIRVLEIDSWIYARFAAKATSGQAEGVSVYLNDKLKETRHTFIWRLLSREELGTLSP